MDQLNKTESAVFTFEFYGLALEKSVCVLSECGSQHITVTPGSFSEQVPQLEVNGYFERRNYHLLKVVKCVV